AYYVNQGDKYHVEKTGDFNLKYQMEFHNSENIEAGGVQIRIPAALLPYRDGRKIPPSDIAVPYAGPDEDPIPSRSTPFNYYIDEESGDLVFYNYKKIVSGSNAAWQVLYKNLEIMEIKDDSTWKLEPKIEVTVTPEEGEPITETGTSTPLTGHINSYVDLISVSKTPHYEGGKSYSPGLYTEEQVSRYAGGLPEKYKGENFKELVKDKPSGAGSSWEMSVVGYRGVSSPGYYAPPESGHTIKDNEFTQVKNGCKEEEWGSRFYIVTAYPASKVTANQTVLENTVDIQLEPADGIDPVQEKSAEAEWMYVDYNWVYPPGKITDVSKGSSGTYTGWLEAFKYASEKYEDLGAFPFSTTGYFRGYDLTHYIENNQEGPLGTYRDGTKYKLTTVDDFMYLYSSKTQQTKANMLSFDDYYFTEVSVTQTDRGYDVWEDRYAEPEVQDGVDQSMVISVMYENEDNWTEVARVPWGKNVSGKLSYTLTQDQLARKPWRVKVEHETVNYDTTCSIDVKVRLRHGSPVMKELMKEYTPEKSYDVKLENISGIIGSFYEGEEFKGYYHIDTAGPNYQESGLAEETRKLYESEDTNDTDGILLQRDNAFKTLTGLQQNANSYKRVKVKNDVNNSRVLLDYCLTAYDGYEIYGQEGVNYLKGANVPSPGRYEVVFYDLLPYGVHLDLSKEIVAGRITSLSGNSYQDRPGSWDKSQVTVTVDSVEDIKPNWRDTGRTMVAFHVKYEGADPAVYTNGMWMEGWGVNFQAYYDW
ncbi:MAG: cell surface protein, partial [Clostridiales bacterium]|nr:cell surface protein [Clostridiales bacterium]